MTRLHLRTINILVSLGLMLSMLAMGLPAPVQANQNADVVNVIVDSPLADIGLDISIPPSDDGNLIIWDQVSGSVIFGDKPSEKAHLVKHPDTPVYTDLRSSSRGLIREGLDSGVRSEWHRNDVGPFDYESDRQVGQLETPQDVISLAGGSISGRVTDGSGNPLVNIPVSLKPNAPGYDWIEACTDSDGNYFLGDVVFGISWVLQVMGSENVCGGSVSYAAEYWQDTYNREHAMPITISESLPNLTGKDFMLESGGGISGHVYRSDGFTPVEKACVAAFSSDGVRLSDWLRGEPDGSFAFYGIPVGTVYIRTDVKCKGINNELINEWYATGGSTPYRDQASAVTINAGEVASGIDFQVDVGGTISGRATDEAGNPLPNIPISVDGPDYGGDDCTDADGQYLFEGLAYSTEWRVHAGDAMNWCGGSNAYAEEYWENTYEWDQATLITISPAQHDVSNINFVLSLGGGITGHVYLADGVTPVEGMCVGASSSVPDLNLLGNWWRTSADGSFTIYGYHIGQIYVRTVADCWGANPANKTLVEEWYATGGSTPDGTQATGVSITGGGLTTAVDFQLDQGGTISGTVIDGVGVPLLNIPVRASSPGIWDEETCSDANGDYSLGGLAQGVGWRVQAMPNGENGCGGSVAYAQEYWQNTRDWSLATPIILTAGNLNVTGIYHSLAPGGGISGHVYRSDGDTPVAGACVNISSSAPGWHQVSGWGTTAADGSFLFYGIPTGTVYVRTHASCAGMNASLMDEWYAGAESTRDGSQALGVTISEGVVNGGIEFKLDLAGSISGHIYQANGVTPIANAWVYAMDGNFDFIAGTYSSADGSYQIGELTTAGYYLAVSATGYGGVYYLNGYDDPNAQMVSVIAPADTGGIDFRLFPEASISGHVYALDGATPLAGAVVWAWPMAGGQTREAVSDASGAYVIHGLSSGEYVVHTYLDGYADEQYLEAPDTWKGILPVRVTQPTNTPGIDFTLSPAGGISGMIYQPDGATPLAGATVLARSLDHTAIANTQSGPDGSFQLNKLSNGQYLIEAFASGYAISYHPAAVNTVDAQPVTVSGSSVTTGINVRLAQEAILSGHVYASDGITPIEGARVYGFSRGVNRVAQTDNTGAYTLGGLGGGSLILSAGGTTWATRYYPNVYSEAEATLLYPTPGDHLSNYDFILEVGATVSGSIYRQDNALPSAGNCVSAYRNVTALSTSPVTKLGGMFTLLRVPPVPVYLVAHNCSRNDRFLVSEYYAPGGSTWDPDQALAVQLSPGVAMSDVRFDLDIGGAIMGRVFEANGIDPIRSLLLELKAISSSGQIFPGKQRIVTQYNGVYLLNGLHPGTYKVTANYNNQDAGYITEYYNNKGDVIAADDVVVNASQTTPWIDFALEKTITTMVGTSGGTLTVADSGTASLIVELPSGAVEEETQLVYAPLPEVSDPDGFRFANSAFTMDAYVAGELQENFTFQEAVIVTFEYTDDQLMGMDEDTLVLFYWNESTSQWEDAACGPYNRYPAENRLSVAVCHLSDFTWLGFYREWIPLFSP